MSATIPVDTIGKLGRRARSARRARYWLACLALPVCMAGGSYGVELSPQTRLRLTVIQWMPLEGQYERWDALSGELVVSPESEITVPVIGTVSVVGKSPEQVADDVADLLRSNLGLVETPNTSIEVVEFPPVYVVGSVMAPGAFPYRPGMTVLQALALAGDRLRSEIPEVSTDRIRLASELRSARENMLRVKARIARLQAEYAQAETIEFPEELTQVPAGLAQEIMAQEQAIFTARANSLSRQAESLEELGELFTAEIETLRARISSIDESIASTESELAGVKTLVEQGIAPVSRRSELERILTATRVDRLDQITAILRAQQSLSEATRNAAGLQDERRTELAQELQAAKAELEELTLKQTTAERVLLQLEWNDPVAAAEAREQMQLQFTIVRQTDGQPVEVPAEDSTALVPGDVLKVTAVSQAIDASTVANADPR